MNFPLPARLEKFCAKRRIDWRPDGPYQVQFTAPEHYQFGYGTTYSANLRTDSWHDVLYRLQSMKRIPS